MSWLTDLFGGKSGNSKQVAPALKQTPQLSSIAEYPLYKSTLEDRIAGRGLGYDQSVLNAATAPYATQQRQNFANYTAPAIAGAASARGLGRSTIPVNQIGLGSQNVESDIANRVAQLTLANEQEKASEKTGAIGQYGNLMGSDYTAAFNNINSQNAQAEAAAMATNANRAANAQMNQNIGTFAVNAVLGTDNPISQGLNKILTPPSSTVPTNTFGSGGLFGQKNAAAVNTGNFNAEELAMLKALLAS